MAITATEPFLLQNRGGVRITGLYTPALTYLRAEHIIAQQTTAYPVESGAKIIDHAERKPNRLMLEAAVSALRYGQDAGLEVWNTLTEMVEQHQLLTIVTRYRQYDNMLLKQATVPESDRYGRSSHFRLELEEILRPEIITPSTPSAAVADQVAPRTIIRGYGDDLAGAPARRVISRIPDRDGD